MLCIGSVSSQNNSKQNLSEVTNTISKQNTNVVDDPKNLNSQPNPTGNISTTKDLPNDPISFFKTSWFWKSILVISILVSMFLVYKKKVNNLDRQDIGLILILGTLVIGFFLFKTEYLTLEIVYKFFN
jgi:hypothetical protein